MPHPVVVVVETFLREVPRVPPGQLEHMRALPAWRARVEAAATMPRELCAHDRYTFTPGTLEDLKVSVLLLLGGDSPPFFRAALERVRAAVPGARIVVLPGQQHVAIDTAPEMFAREVVDVLTRQWRYVAGQRAGASRGSAGRGRGTLRPEFAADLTGKAP